MEGRKKRRSVKKPVDKSRDEDDSDSDFELDLSGGTKDGNAEKPDRFMLLCDGVYSSLALLNTSLAEFYQLKDEILKHWLPLKMLTAVTLTATRIQRHHADLCIPIAELTGMVRLYCKAWDEKSAPLKKIRQDQESKQRQLDIALRKIEVFSAEEERMQKERRILNWEKLYAKLYNSKSQGYRWKFLIESFKVKIDKGLTVFNPYMSDSDESDDDAGPTQLQSSDDELKDLPSDSDGESNADKTQGRRSHSSSLRNKTSSASSRSKKVRFADEDSPELDEVSFDHPKSPYPTPVESHDASTWTQEPTYDCHLLLCAYRPNSLEPEKELCCTFALGSNFQSSTKFSKLRKMSSQFSSFQEFWFHLSKSEARQFAALSSAVPLDLPSNDPDTFVPHQLPKLSIAVYANNIASDILAMRSIPLKDIKISTMPYRVKPPVDRSVKFVMDKPELCSQLMVDDGTVKPTLYDLMGTEGDSDDIGGISLCCHLVMVEEPIQWECSTDMISFEELVKEMGYRKVQEACSRSTSPMKASDEMELTSATPDVNEKDDNDQMTQEQYAMLSLQHAEELRELQDQYEKKLESLTRTLSQMKKEKAKQESQLTAQEQAYQELEELYKAKSSGKSPEHRTPIRKKLVHPHNGGLPDWGTSFPADFFERMELFAQESFQRHETLATKIRREVSNNCERQMASQHKLAQSVHTNYSGIMEDVSLPAILMPTKLGHMYSPRAHCYFHPTGTSEPRVTQAPTVFKLPILKNKDKMTTLNLFDINELFCHSPNDGDWTKTLKQSPVFTPAPPPSACGFHNNSQSTSPILVKKVK